jgi:hypothetical protein
MLKHFATVFHAVMLVVQPKRIRYREPLTRRPCHDSANQSWHAGKVTNVATCDLVLRLDDAERAFAISRSSLSERAVQKTDAWKK